MGTKKPRVVIIGCGDAGLSAAFASARYGADVTVISDEKEYYPRCPLPYFIAGQIKREDIAQPLEKVFKGTGIKTINDRAKKIEDRKVICRGAEIKFDRAIICTGANPKRLKDSLSLRTLSDAEEIKIRGKSNKPVIIGAGMLGCELVDVLGGTLIEAQDRILPNFDPEFSEMIEAGLSKTAEIKKGIKKVPKGGFVISAIGVTPEFELAKESNIKTSNFGIVVDNRLETSMPNVYAAGDCMEEKCFFTKAPMHSYLGPQSERQGVIAGVNATGGDMRYEGALNAVVAKIAGYELGITGLCSLAAKKNKINTTFGRIKAKSKAEYYTTSKELMIKMVFEGNRLVGCQAIGGEAIEGITNLASYAMAHGATVDDLINLSYCYSPPICSAPNPIVLCAENAKRRMKK